MPCRAISLVDRVSRLVELFNKTTNMLDGEYLTGAVLEVEAFAQIHEKE